MRTLVISDLHLGLGRRRAVLESPLVLERLLAALDGVGRLVLLGDTVELTGRPRGRSLAAADPILRAVGRRLGADAEVVVVPGNHDRPLIGRWLRRHPEALAIDTVLPPDASPELARLVGRLAPARVEVRYPGLWLADGVWGTHGHYLNRHLVPESSYGWLRARLGRPDPRSARPADYERLASRERGSRRLFGVGVPEAIGVGVPEALRPARFLAWAVPDALHPGRLLGHLVDPRFAPLVAPLLSAQMQHASLPAMARVARRLGVDAQSVVFGHVHRLGPRDGDGEGRWRAPGAGPTLLNTGSWVYESALLSGATPPHPYWPGGAVVLEDDAPPRAVGLLDDLDARALRGR